MTQIAKKWVADSAIDHTKLDSSDVFTVRGLTVKNALGATTFNVDSSGNVQANTIVTSGDETNYDNIVIAHGSPDSTWALEAGISTTGDFQIRRAGDSTGAIYFDGVASRMTANYTTVLGDATVTGNLRSTVRGIFQDATVSNLSVGLIKNDASVVNNLRIGNDASVSNLLTVSRIRASGSSTTIDATSLDTESALRATNLISGGVALKGHAQDGRALFADNSSSLSAVYVTNAYAGGECLRTETSADSAIALVAKSDGIGGVAIQTIGSCTVAGQIDIDSGALTAIDASNTGGAGAPVIVVNNAEYGGIGLNANMGDGEALTIGNASSSVSTDRPTIYAINSGSGGVGGTVLTAISQGTGGKAIHADAAIAADMTGSVNVEGPSGVTALRVYSPDALTIDATAEGTAPAVNATNLTSGGSAFTGHAIDGWGLSADNSSTISATIYATNAAASDAGCIFANTSAEDGVAVKAQSDGINGIALKARGRVTIDSGAYTAIDATNTGSAADPVIVVNNGEWGGIGVHSIMADGQSLVAESKSSSVSTDRPTIYALNSGSGGIGGTTLTAISSGTGGKAIHADAAIAADMTGSVNVEGPSGVTALRVYSPDALAVDATAEGTAPAIHATNLTSGGSAFTGHAVDGWALYADNSSTTSATIYVTNTAAGDAGCVYANTSAVGGIAIKVQSDGVDGTAIKATGICAAKLTGAVIVDSTSTNDPTIRISAVDNWALNADNSSIVRASIYASNAAADGECVRANSSADRGIGIAVNSGGSDGTGMTVYGSVCAAILNGAIILYGVPSSDPGVQGQLFSDGSHICISL